MHRLMIQALDINGDPVGEQMSAYGLEPGEHAPTIRVSPSWPTGTPASSSATSSGIRFSRSATRVHPGSRSSRPPRKDHHECTLHP